MPALGLFLSREDVRRTRTDDTRKGLPSMHKDVLGGEDAVEHADLIETDEPILDLGDEKADFVHVRLDENTRRLSFAGVAVRDAGLMGVPPPEPSGDLVSSIEFLTLTDKDTHISS